MSEFIKQFYHAMNIPCGEEVCLTLQVALCSEGAMSWHCGYITLPNALYARINLDNLSPHGGFTYNRPGDFETTIGFDCAHSGDSLYRADSNWRDYFFVMGELTRLATQIIAQLR